jgi:hypothetical protein
MDLDNFFSKGYTTVNDQAMFLPLEKILNTIEWEQETYTHWYWRPKQTSALKDALLETHKLLAEKYISNTFPNYELGYRDLWNGIDIGADNYHNDLNEGPNAMFLLHFNDMNEETGGGFAFRNSVTEEETGFMYPKKYDIIFGSQQDNWEHRATKLNIIPVDRIVANFGMYLKGI